MTSSTFGPTELVTLRRVGALALHPDQEQVAVVVERLDRDGTKYVADLWHLDTRGGAPRRLTRGESKDRAPAYGPDGTLYFLSDRSPEVGKDEDKRAQVWALPAAGGDALQVTDEPHGVSDFRVQAGTLVCIASWLPGVDEAEQRDTAATQKKSGPSLRTYRSMPVRFWDHWLGPQELRLVAYDVGAGLASGRRVLTEASSGAGMALRDASWDLSADGARLAVAWATMGDDRIEDRPIALIDARTGDRSMIGVEPGLVHYALRFSPDGASLAASRYLRSPDGYAARSLWVYRDGVGRPLTEAWDRWPGAYGWTHDGASIIAVAEDEATTPLFAIDAVSGAHTRIGPRAGSWEHVVIGRELIGVRSTLLTPPEVFALAHAPDAEPRPLGALSGFTPSETPPTVTSERVPVGGREVQTFVVEPARPNGRTILWVHGGPVSAWADHWHGRWSSLLMAEQGYRVVMPNPAGSTGFGIDWVNGIWGNVWGARCFDEIMGVADWLEARGFASRDSVLMGGSFGGYMTNWVGGHSDRFRLLVSHASLFTLSSFHLATDVPAWWELMWGGNAWSDPDFDRFAPSRFVPAWKTPTLVVHGEKDYRVPVTEGLALFEALQRHGVTSELAIFPDENHWILKPKNIIAWYETVLDFLERHWNA